MELWHLRPADGVKAYAQIAVASRAELRDWLRAHFDQAESIWLVTAKRNQRDYVMYQDIVEEALCFGWVDSLPRALDGERSMLLLSPRKPGSAWSKPNRDRATRLIVAGQMHPAGLAKVRAAKTDGSWDFLKIAESGAVPSDLAAALDAEPGARAGYDAFSAPTRRRIVEYLMRAKRPETRAARIAKVVAGARQGRDPLQWHRRSGS